MQDDCCRWREASRCFILTSCVLSFLHIFLPSFLACSCTPPARLEPACMPQLSHEMTATLCYTVKSSCARLQAASAT